MKKPFGLAPDSVSHDILFLLEEVRRQAAEMEKEIMELKYEYPAQRFKRVKGVNLW